MWLCQPMDCEVLVSLSVCFVWLCRAQWIVGSGVSSVVLGVGFLLGYGGFFFQCFG